MRTAVSDDLRDRRLFVDPRSGTGRFGPATGPGRQQRPHGSQWNLTRWTALAGSKGGRCGSTYVVGISKGVRGVCSGLREVGGQADTPELPRTTHLAARMRRVPSPWEGPSPAVPRGVSGTIDPAGSLPTAAGGRTNHGEKTCSSPSSRCLYSPSWRSSVRCFCWRFDLRYAPVVAPKARANTGSPGSLHARALSGGRQGGKAGRSRQGAGGGKPRQPAPAHAIGRRWQTPRPFRFDPWLRLPE